MIARLRNWLLEETPVRRLDLVVLALGVVAVWATVVIRPAEGATTTPCGPRAAFLEQWSARYGEHPAGGGLASNGAVLELMTTADLRGWTLVYTDAQGVTCVAAAGRDWEWSPRRDGAPTQRAGGRPDG